MDTLILERGDIIKVEHSFTRQQEEYIVLNNFYALSLINRNKIRPIEYLMDHAISVYRYDNTYKDELTINVIFLRE